MIKNEKKKKESNIKLLEEKVNINIIDIDNNINGIGKFIDMEAINTILLRYKSIKHMYPEWNKINFIKSNISQMNDFGEFMLKCNINEQYNAIPSYGISLGIILRRSIWHIMKYGRFVKGKHNKHHNKGKDKINDIKIKKKLIMEDIKSTFKIFSILFLIMVFLSEETTENNNIYDIVLNIIDEDLESELMSIFIIQYNILKELKPDTIHNLLCEVNNKKQENILCMKLIKQNYDNIYSIDNRNIYYENTDDIGWIHIKTNNKDKDKYIHTKDNYNQQENNYHDKEKYKNRKIAINGADTNMNWRTKK